MACDHDMVCRLSHSCIAKMTIDKSAFIARSHTAHHTSSLSSRLSAGRQVVSLELGNTRIIISVHAAAYRQSNV